MARATNRRGDRRNVTRRLQSWLSHHAITAGATLRQLLTERLATTMTVAAIAIALALPAALYLLVENLKALGGSWESSTAISLFLDPRIDEEQAARLAQTLAARSDVARAAIISRQDGLAEFREYSGLGAALDQLVENPLPVVIALYPAPWLRTQAELDQLASALEQLTEVDFARMDTEWAQRLLALLALLREALWLLGLALGLAVLLVIGNTIRLEIENRRDEIEIMSLVGATAAFIRRPFLYIGAWYGLLGGLLAWVLVAAAVLWLQAPADRLAERYHGQFMLLGLDARASLTLILGATALGMLGGWIAVARHLGRLAPPRF